jgi:lipopolysaccharide/colanic/teichoic acid biosynthesis glycosyltransferase
MIEHKKNVVISNLNKDSKSSYSLLNVSDELRDLGIKVNFYTIFGKRIFDFSFSLILLVALSPVLILLYTITYFSSKGPAFFFQKRVGKNGKVFYMIKFRSMRVNSEPFGPQLTSKNDPRVTKWGKVMRKYYLDELPQLINILVGEMSLIGPRPERRYFINKLKEREIDFDVLLNVKPGLSSLGQIEVGYASDIETMEERLVYEKKYLKMISIFTDFKIILKTIKKVVYGFGV